MRLRVQSSTWKLAALGLCVLAAVAVGGVFAGLAIFSGGAGSLPAMPTTGAYAPVSIPAPLEGGVADPDSMSRQGHDLATVLSRAPGSHRYRLTVSNVSSLRLINALDCVS